MCLIVKLWFGFHFKYFLQHKACSCFAAIPEISQIARLQFRPNPEALLWKWRQNFSFKINIPTVNSLASTSKVFIFKLNIENYFKTNSALIGSKFLPLCPDQICCVFSGTFSISGLLGVPKNYKPLNSSCGVALLPKILAIQ